MPKVKTGGSQKQPTQPQDDDTTKTTRTLFDVTNDTTEHQQVLRLQRLELRHFKGIAHAVLDAKGSDVLITGENGVGKTTFMDGYFWLLFDKDSEGLGEFNIKPLDSESNPIHNLESEVEGVFTWKGRTFSLKKVRKEKWTKKRGSPTPEFTGHTIDYLIDSVPVRKTDYDRYVKDITNEGAFRALTDPRYFNEVLHWKKRREILLDICGDITDEDVLRVHPEFDSIAHVLERGFDNHRKVVKATQGKLDKRIEEIPIRISEIQRGLPDVSKIDEGALQNELAAARAARRAKADEIARMRQGGGIGEKQEELAQIRAQLMDLEISARRKSEETVYAKRKELQDTRLSISELERTIQRIVDDIARNKTTIENLDVRIEKLRQEWYEADEQGFEYAAETVCPTCNQDLPQEMVEEARQKALEQFNLQKGRRLESITADGKTLATEKEQAEDRIKKLQAERKTAETRLKNAQVLVQKLRAEVKKQGDQVDVTRTAEYSKLAERRGQLEWEIENIKADNKETLSLLTAELEESDSRITALEKANTLVEERHKGLRRVEELKAEEKELAAEYERIQQELHLMERFEHAKAAMLEEQVGSYFSIVDFKLFKPLINGGVDLVCETLVDGVPYTGGLNTGHRIIAGLDIINTLQKHWGLSVPVWVDRAESLTVSLPVDTQVIRLAVTPGTLDIEIQKEVA